jgi:hypothetical protein
LNKYTTFGLTISLVINNKMMTLRSLSLVFDLVAMNNKPLALGT